MWPGRTIASLLILLQLAACYAWKPSKVTPAQTVQDERLVEVQLTDGSKVFVADPWVRDDTLGGKRSNHHSQFHGGRPWAVPVDSVAVIRTPKRNTVVSVVYTVVASVAAVAALMAMYYSGAFD